MGKTPDNYRKKRSEMTPEELEAARAYDRAMRLKHLSAKRERNRAWYRNKSEEEKQRVKDNIGARRRERASRKVAQGEKTTNLTPYAKAVRNVRNRLWGALKRYALGKEPRWRDGSLHLQLATVFCRMKPGMTISNYGKVWEMDHVIPCAWFDVSREDHRYACMHVSNVNPEFRSENRRRAVSVSRRHFDEVLERCPLECRPVIEEIIWKIRRREYPEGLLRRVRGHV